jgi:uncharacterized protein YraI
MKSITAQTLFAPALAAALWVAPGISAAQQLAYAAKDVNLRAGPDRDYPVVAIARTGVALTVMGCLPDYRWCDVIVGASRGWVYAGNIAYPYQGATVPVLTYGALLGIGIVTFSIGSYWDDHYRYDPWYPQRPYWIERPRPIFRPDVRPLPLPPGHGVRPLAPQPGRGVRPPSGAQPPGPPARVPGILQRQPQSQGPNPGSAAPQAPGAPRTGGGQRPGPGQGPHQR